MDLIKTATIKTATIRMVKITIITMKTILTEDLAEMVDSIMDRASVGPEMADGADMVKAARGEEDRVDPVVETKNPAIAQIPLLPAIPVQNPGQQTPAVPVPTAPDPKRNPLRNPPVAPVVQAAQVPER